MVAAGDHVRWPWLDPLLAGVVLVVMEIAVLTGSHHRGPLVLNLIVVAGMALAAIWRRRSPLLFLVIVGALSALMNYALTSLNSLPLTAAYVLLVPTYTVGAWEKRPKAVLGLTIFICGAAVSALVVRHQSVGDFAGGALLVCAAWAVGRAIRSRRVLTSELGSPQHDWRLSVRIAHGWPLPASAHGSRASCTRSSRAASQRW
jgi:hypothetical protein